MWDLCVRDDVKSVSGFTSPPTRRNLRSDAGPVLRVTGDVERWFYIPSDARYRCEARPCGFCASVVM